MTLSVVANIAGGRILYKNLCPATICASIMAANVWKNSLKNVESDNNKIIYETLLDFFTAKRYLLSEQASYKLLRSARVILICWIWGLGCEGQ